MDNSSINNNKENISSSDDINNTQSIGIIITFCVIGWILCVISWFLYIGCKQEKAAETEAEADDSKNEELNLNKNIKIEDILDKRGYELHTNRMNKMKRSASSSVSPHSKSINIGLSGGRRQQEKHGYQQSKSIHVEINLNEISNYNVIKLKSPNISTRIMRHNDLSLYNLNTVTIASDIDNHCNCDDDDDIKHIHGYELDSNYGVQLMMEGKYVVKNDDDKNLEGQKETR